MTPRRLALRLSALLIATAGVASCAETVVEMESDDGEINVGGSFETIPTTTLPLVGTTTELLVEMSLAMSRLSSEISAPGDERATLERIESIWAIAGPDVEATNPELAGPMETTVQMARTAVVRVRPADGDKAFQLLTGLIDRYSEAS